MFGDENTRVLLELNGLSKLLPVDDLGLMQLVNKSKTLQLVVPCDGNLLYQLKIRGAERINVRYDTLLPEVLSQLYKLNHGTPLEVEIYDVKDGEYQVRLIDPQKSIDLPIRCSDAILLSNVWKIPVYATIHVLKTQAVPYVANSEQLPVPINVLNEELLEQALDEAVENEDYEKASYIKEQLESRKKMKK